MPSKLYLLLLIQQTRVVTASISPQTLYFEQKIDHFNPQQLGTWQHRYLISDQYWDGSGELVNGCKGPILLYAGNEGDITDFWDNNGFMIDYLAPLWGALLVFPEERCVIPVIP